MEVSVGLVLGDYSKKMPNPSNCKPMAAMSQ